MRTQLADQTTFNSKKEGMRSHEGGCVGEKKGRYEANHGGSQSLAGL